MPAEVISVAAIVFDLDGVLVDSHAAVERHWQDLGARLGLDFDALGGDLRGRPSDDVIVQLLGTGHPALEEHQRWFERHEVEGTDGVVAMPGALALVDRLAETDVPWAIGKSCTAPLAAARMQAAGIAAPPVIVTADQVVEGKPAPDTYLEAFARLDVDPRLGVVFEDSDAGLLAARRAGATAVGISAGRSPDDLDGHHVVPDLRSVRIDQHTLRLSPPPT
jgi:sugar-phosphatase